MAAPPAPPAQAYAAPNTPIAYIHDPEAAFEDAPDDHSAPAAAADAPAELELAHDEEDDDEDVYWDEDDEDEEWAQLGAVEDEDWGGHEKGACFPACWPASSSHDPPSSTSLTDLSSSPAPSVRPNPTTDFSKQYNRLKQYQSAVSNPAPQPTRAGPSAASGSGSGGLKQHSSSAVRSTPLPAINRSRPAPALASSSSNASAAASSSAGPTTAVAESRLARLINLAPYAPSPTVNTKAAADRQNQKDKSDRATVEQVLDARTRLVLAKLINKGLVGAVEGCVSTGKEANVYHAWPPATPPVPTAHNPNPPVLPKQIALKIFKTSILVFKDREKYITGEFRFKGGQSKNPRKMVRSASFPARPPPTLTSPFALFSHRADPLSRHALLPPQCGPRRRCATSSGSRPPASAARARSRCAKMCSRWSSSATPTGGASPLPRSRLLGPP